MDLYPLSQSIRTGYAWATAHGVTHNHTQLFEWLYQEEEDGATKPRAASACAVGFGWIGNLLLNGTDEQEIFATIRAEQNTAMGEYDQYVRDTNGHEERVCPEPHCTAAWSSLASMVVHLNDAHDWDIEAIIEYVLAQEPEEETVEIVIIKDIHAPLTTATEYALVLGLEDELVEEDLPW